MKLKGTVVIVFGDLIQESEFFVNEAISQIDKLSEEACDVAALDVKMLEAAIVHSGGVPTTALCNLVDQLSAITGQPTGITYEEIVQVNPLLSDPRAFTRNTAEKWFYLGHALIEETMDRAVELAFLAQVELEQKGAIKKAASLITDVAGLILTVQDLTRHIGADMDPRDFAVFRPYLGSHPIRGTNGPSGKFSPGVPTIDFLAAGKVVESSYTNLAEELQYYPRSGQVNIQRALAIAHFGNSLRDFVRGHHDEELTVALDALSGSIRKFRGDHYGAVKKHVPGALTGGQVGTGGEMDPGTFLRDRMKLHRKNI